MITITSSKIGQTLKHVREQKKITQEQLASKVGKKRSYIARIESESGNNIKVQTLIDIIEKGYGGTVMIKL